MFSAFVDQHLRRALELAYRFEQVTVESGLDAALRAIQEALIAEPIVGLVLLRGGAASGRTCAAQRGYPWRSRGGREH